MSVSYNTKIDTEKLVINLDAGNVKSYPGSGSTWYDLSGNSNHCVWSVAPTYTKPYFTFDGSATGGTITNNTTLDFSSNKTLIIVMRHTYVSGRRNPWDQAYGGYGTWTHEQGEYINEYLGDSGANASPYIGVGSPATPRSVWNIMCTTRDFNQQKWYINGTLSSTTAHSYGSLKYTSSNISIGYGYAGYWQGDMAMILAYTKTLSDDGVKQNFNALRGRFSL